MYESPLGGPAIKPGCRNFIQLICAFGLVLIALGPMPSYADPSACASAFESSLAFEYRIQNDEPAVHLASPDYEKSVSLIGRPIEIGASLKAFDPENEPERYFWIRWPTQLKFQSFDAAQKVLTVRGPLNERRFRVEEISDGLRLHELPARPNEAVPITEPKREFKISEIGDRKEFVRKNLSSHLRASATTSKRDRFRELRDSYAYMVDKVADQKKWSVMEIESLNWMVNIPTAKVLRAEDYLGYGVLRGTRRKVTLDAESYQLTSRAGYRTSIELPGATDFFVDLRNAEAFDNTHQQFYMPARLVPKAVSSWVAKLNSVNEKTELLSIIQLYRDFIVIHPFGNGNGRTARILIDDMLMRAGFGPIPKGSQWLSEILFVDLNRVTLDLAAAYRGEFNRKHETSQAGAI